MLSVGLRKCLFEEENQIGVIVLNCVVRPKMEQQGVRSLFSWRERSIVVLMSTGKEVNY